MGNDSSKSPVTSAEESSCSNPNPLLSSILTSSRYSDLTIICNYRRFPVHRAVICMQSNPLAAAIDGGFQESITGEIDLSEHNPHAVECMISFLYTSQYDDGQDSLNPPEVSNAEESSRLFDLLPFTTGTYSGDDEDNTSIQNQEMNTLNTHISTPQSSPLVLNTQIYVLAEKYDIPALKVLSATKYKQLTSPTAPSPKFLSELIASLQIIHEGTPSSDTHIRNTSFSALTTHVEALTAPPYLESFEELCMYHPEISIKLIALAKANLREAGRNQYVKMCINCRTCYDVDTVECRYDTSFRPGEMNCYVGGGLSTCKGMKGSRKTRYARALEARRFSS